MNGAFSLPQPLRVEFSKATWTAPVSNDVVDVTFKQAIGANDALRTGVLLEDADVHAVDDDAVDSCRGSRLCRVPLRGGPGEAET